MTIKLFGYQKTSSEFEFFNIIQKLNSFYRDI